MTVAIRDNAIPSDHEMMVYKTMSQHAVASKMYKGIGDESAVMMIMLAARELGLPPMQCLNGGINIINGKIEISARMMSAMVRRAGHQIKIKESTDTSCTLLGRRNDEADWVAVTYSVADAQRAGLVKPGGGWVKNPKDMCFARCISRLSRQLFSDVIGIGYVEGEIKPAEAEVIVPDDIPADEPEEQENVEHLESALASLFAAEDPWMVGKFVEITMQHYGWTKAKTIKEMLKEDSNVVHKFQTWRNKWTSPTDS